MSLGYISINNVRNIEEISFYPCLGVNIFYGNNGSGKSSLLEAIHILSLGRSYRTKSINDVIKIGKDGMTVFGKLAKNSGHVKLGLSKYLNGKLQANINGVAQSSLLELTQMLPIVVIDRYNLQLLDGGAQIRRNFIDWGTFYSYLPRYNNKFYLHLQQLKKIITQRNILLRKGDINSLSSWDSCLLNCTEIITKQRTEYLYALKELLSVFINKFFPDKWIWSFDYDYGWPKEYPFEQVLHDARARDLRNCYTSVGPHRADIKIMVNNRLAKNFLSNGQKKMLVCALRLAQVALIKKQLHNRDCIVLLDDIGAELDKQSYHNLIESLVELNSQLFITDVDKVKISSLINTGYNAFLVEQGNIVKDE